MKTQFKSSSNLRGVQNNEHKARSRLLSAGRGRARAPSTVLGSVAVRAIAREHTHV